MIDFPDTPIDGQVFGHDGKFFAWKADPGVWQMVGDGQPRYNGRTRTKSIIFDDTQTQYDIVTGDGLDPKFIWYEFQFINYKFHTSNNWMLIRFSADGVSYDSGSSDYRSATSDTSTSSGSSIAAGFTGTAIGAQYNCATFYLWHPHQNQDTSISTYTMSLNSSENGYFMERFGYRNAAYICNGIRFQSANGGRWASGRLDVYGYEGL